MKNRTFFMFLFIIFIWINTNAQINIGGEPISFMYDQSLKSNLDYKIMPVVDVESLTAEDIINDQYKDIPWRFGFNFEVDYSMENSGVWDVLPKGDKLWRLAIKCEGAFTINLIFDNYYLPPEAKLFVYNADKSQIIGAFTDFNNQEDRYFATTLISGDAIIIEYYEPHDAEFSGELKLESITHGYRDAYSYAKGLGSSGSCNNNVACPVAAGWENQVSSACMLVSGGNGFCSGALINNTNGDGTPYVLSANHCYSTPGSVVYWFNWESPTCTNPTSSPPYNSMSGAVQRSRNSASDFWLVELNSIPPASYNVYYAGWNREDAASSSSVGIHHPSGDIKKISFDYDPSVTSDYDPSPYLANSHWEITAWNDGTTEGGSSGSPLFDQYHRITGQLHGGWASCTSITQDYYGKFSMSWDYGSSSSTRLMDWLDPSGISGLTLDGYDPNNPTVLTANFTGNPTTVVVGNTVTFTNLSNGPNPITSYSWSFPGGIPSSANTAGPHTVTYNTLGTYNVSLTVGDGSDTDIETKTNYITVTNCIYCASTYSDLDDDYISNVTFNTINNTSGGTTIPDSYEDFTSISTDIAPGNNYSISVSIIMNGNWTQHARAFFDWNQDCDFNDSGESYYLGQVTNTGTINSSIDVPITALTGTTRMRIVEQYNTDPTTACDPHTTTYGSTEDYTVNVLSGGVPPVAEFEANNVAPGIGETVTFTDLSTNTPTSWSWVFTPSTVTYTGGTTAADQNPEVQFDVAGDYTVELTATNISGSDAETKVDYIFVIDVPVADFEADNVTPGIGETVNFTDLSTNNPIDWAWTFTPPTVTYVGGTTASSQNPEVQFDAAGDYTVELTATNISGSDAETKVDYIFVIDVPTTDFEADNVTPGIGETVTFTDLSTNTPTSWSWIFTPSTVTFVGGTTASSQNPEVQFDAAGDYTVELTATNISGSDTETKTDYIFVINVPVADFEADNLTPDIGETVSFTDLSTNSPISWSWVFTPSTVTYVGGTTASSQNPEVQFDAAGDYTVELTATNISSSDIEIKINYIDALIPVLNLDIKAFLEGPFNGSLMNADIGSDLPLNQPYNVAPWNYNGSETVIFIPPNVVDWVLIEVRDAASAAMATSATGVSKQAAFVLNDGSIVDLDGSSNLQFEAAISQNMFVVVWQRNHLGIISNDPLIPTGNLYTYDFTTGVNQVFGGIDGHKEISIGIWGMIGGDGNHDGVVNINDKSPLWETEVGKQGYIFSDSNLDGETNNQDKNDIWVPNENKDSKVPD